MNCKCVAWRILTAFFVSALTVLISCARTTSQKRAETPKGEEAAESILTAKDLAAARLKGKVRGNIAFAADSVELQEKRLHYSPPYFYKRYEMYPKGEEGFEMEVLEEDNEFAPFKARVIIPKVVFSTKFHANRNMARADSDFVREEGEAAEVYQYRNGQWELLHSTFEAKASSVYRDGQWVPAPPNLERVAPGEAKSWWDKFLGWFDFLHR